MILDTFKEQGLVPDWIGFYRDAVNHGWHPERTLKRLENEIEGVYGPEYLLVWKQKMSQIA